MIRYDWSDEYPKKYRWVSRNFIKVRRTHWSRIVFSSSWTCSSYMLARVSIINRVWEELVRLWNYRSKHPYRLFPNEQIIEHTIALVHMTEDLFLLIRWLSSKVVNKENIYWIDTQRHYLIFFLQIFDRVKISTNNLLSKSKNLLWCLCFNNWTELIMLIYLIIMFWVRHHPYLEHDYIQLSRSWRR